MTANRNVIISIALAVIGGLLVFLATKMQPTGLDAIYMPDAYGYAAIGWLGTGLTALAVLFMLKAHDGV